VCRSLQALLKYLLLKKLFFRTITNYYRINNKAKVQQLIQLLVIRKAKVISYKDLDIAYIAYIVKDKATIKKSNRKRSYKRKVLAQETENNIKDKVKDSIYALEVGLLVCTLKDKKTNLVPRSLSYREH
jgi:hypothetical protein